MSPIRATGWYRERGSWVKSASRLQTAPSTHSRKRTHTHAREQSRAPAYSSLVKGRVGLAGTQTLCICISEGAESGGARRDRGGRKLTFNQKGTLLFLHITLYVRFTFFGTVYFSPALADFACDSADCKGARHGERPGRISGEETSLCAERRASLRTSAARLGAVGTRDRAVLRCGSPPV